jgi:hypothetical protein
MRSRVFLMSLVVFVAVGLGGCKKSCRTCELYIEAVQECVKTNPPSADELAKHLESCQEFCAKKEATEDREQRALISEKFMKKESCVLEHQRGGCEPFNKCLEKAAR